MYRYIHTYRELGDEESSRYFMRPEFGASIYFDVFINFILLFLGECMLVLISVVFAMYIS